MTTLLISDEAFLQHDTGRGHPERADRLRSIVSVLEGREAFANLRRASATPAARAQIVAAHPEPYVDAILAAAPASGHVHLDPDTVMSPGSLEAALKAAGALCQAVDGVMRGEVTNAFCAVRPPGHHAEATRAMGFCIFNSVAVAAHHARNAHGLTRVAAVDFDVHHGNGTQHIFERDADLFYASSHQYPLYPGTGSESEQGVGNVVNAPLSPYSGSVEFRRAWEVRILPALKAFKPELLLISAGFDAHAHDPLGQLNLEEEDYLWVTRELLAITDSACQGRVVSALEGGYDLKALSESVAVHVEGLMAA